MSELKDSDGLIVLPPELPLLPIRDLVVFPFMVVPLFVSRDVSMAAVDACLTADRLLFLCAQKSSGADLPGPNDLYRVGTVGKVLRMRKLPDGQVKILVQGLRRARFLEILKETPYVAVKPLALEEDHFNAASNPEVEGLMRAVKDSLVKLGERGKGLPQDVMAVLTGLDDAGALADLVASNLGLKVGAAQLVLETDATTDRLRRVNEILAKEIEVVAWQQKIETQAKEEMSRTQREYFLREQLKQIKTELGDRDSKGEEIEDLRRRLLEARLPEDAAREAAKQLRRLEQMHVEAAEASVVRTYLDWLADLPWDKESKEQIDLSRAQQILEEDHHGLEKIKERILEYLGVIKLKRDHKGPILCFVGPPGVGKTSLGRSIARALGRQFVRISLGGVHDESEIRGHRRTYVGAMPGRIIAGLKQAGARNPVFVLDELDKIGSDVRGDPSAALLEVLDPEQNNSFRDHYLNLPFDLSRVLWVGTANLVDPIPAALCDRMEIIRLPGYHMAEKVVISRRFLIPRVRDSSGLEPSDLRFTTQALERLIESYTREAGVRDLERQIAAIARKVARKKAEGSSYSVRVTEQSLSRYLGHTKHDPDRPEGPDEVGVAVGLAWTEAGGALLQVEVTQIAGKTQLILTGQLGKVMKESAQAALTCTRSRAAELGVAESTFSEHEFHVHVPQGAIPKDGPSAGITICTAIASQVTGFPVRNDVAMTGEITLRGRVLPVGGVRDKFLAALRCGKKEIILPEANQHDLDEVPQALRNKVRVHVVKRIEEVWELALAGYKERPRPALPPVPRPVEIGRA